MTKDEDALYGDAQREEDEPIKYESSKERNVDSLEAKNLKCSERKIKGKIIGISMQ